MDKPTWLEVSLTVDGELAEAVADVLGRFAPGGVVVESTAVTAEPDDAEGRAIGPLRVYAYLQMDACIEETRHKLEESLWYLGRIRPLPAAQFKVVEETNWAEAWKVHYRPIAIGEQLMIVPAWLDAPDDRRICVRIDPGMAFGTGTHPTTQLCLEFLETLVSPGDDIIDVGCGTAILAVAALKLGARRALGVDIDPEAVHAAQENAQVNGVTGQLELGQGSVAEILMGKFGLRRVPIVVANILAPVLVRLLDEGLGQLVEPGGKIILSGILEGQVDEVNAAASKVRLQPIGDPFASRRQIADWVALAYQQPSS